uniref:kinesin-like protein KIF16B isoform X2 n=1 Tax=Oncorhynchus gorbuscha TaxID=8017 RepID=UPI001EAF5DC5|nr:kinesin-like protein KIF16B isoform X2 [Oncorhynchus gorbuscha]
MGNVSRKTGAQVRWRHQAFAVRCSSQVIWTKVRRAMASVCVAVRVRPLNQREKEMSAKVIIHMKGKTISVDGNNKDIHKGIPGIGLTDRGRHSFSYDFSYDSTDVGSPNFVPQEKVFKDLGCDVLKAAFEGYNACVFAYGQTGSGKSYTMIGNPGDLGLIPRICDGLFCHISEMDQVDGASYRIEVSYLEIDNERVQDLLTTKTDPGSGSGLHLREHPKDGPYVENLSTHLVQNYTDIEELMHAANAKLITANTGMNDVSSRSHSIFTVIITQVRFKAVLPCETVSKIHLVDLAGSERTGARLKEGANINKSLVTLGSVISALADTCVTGEGSSHTGKMKKQLFIPYRDSLLTWLLMNSLGGNSKTIMIATISPADVHYGETLSTLRYANRAKNIVDCGLVDEDSGVKVIRELQEEIGRLRGLMENNIQEETVALRNEGIRVVLDSEPPHLISIDDDLLSTAVIFYHLKECRTLVGRHEAPSNQDMGSVIQLRRGTMFHFNHPKETVQLREQRKSALLSSRSMAHLSEPTENLSKEMLFHSGMDVLAAVGLTGVTRQQRSSVVLSPLKTCTVMADGCTVEPNTSPGVLSGLSSDGCSRRLYKAGACYSGPAETSLGAVVSHLQRGDEGEIDGGTEEGTHHAHFPLASSSSTYTQTSRFDKHTASLSQTEHTASRLDRDRHRRSQAVRGLPLAALEGQFSRCIMNSSKTTVEGYGDYYKEETQAGARREEVSRVSRGEEAQAGARREVEKVSRVSRGEETQAGARREEEVEKVSRVSRGEEAQAGARREEVEQVSRVSRSEEAQAGARREEEVEQVSRVSRGEEAQAGARREEEVEQVSRVSRSEEAQAGARREEVEQVSRVSRGEENQAGARREEEVEQVSRVSRGEENQAGARREEEVEQVSRVSRGEEALAGARREEVSRVSRGEENQAGARREEEVEQVSRVSRGEEALAGARREEEVSRVSRGEETQDESQFSASGLGALVSRVSQISGLGGKHELDSLGEESSISGMGSVVSSEVSISGMGSVVSSEVSISGIGSVVSSEVSVRFPDMWRLLHSSLPRVLQQFWDSTGIRGDGGMAGSLQPGAVGGACSSWPSQVVSMVRESLVLSVVKDSQVFSLVRESHMFSYVKDSRVFSIVSELPLVQQMSTELTHDFRSIPIELTHDFRSIPIELTHDFRSIPIELTHDFRSIPIELTHDFRSIPIELTHDFRSIPIELTRDLQQVESTGIQQRAAPKMNLSLLTTQNTVFSPAPSLYPAQNATEFPHRENTGKEVDWRTGEQNPIRELEWTPEGRQEAPSTSEVQITTKEELWSPEDQIKMAEDPQCVTDGSKPQSPPEQGDNARSAVPEKSSVPGQAKQWTEGVQVYYQRLMEFPGALVQLQSLPVFTLLACLQSVVPSVFTSQRLVALYWLGVANCSQPHPHPSVVLLFESCLYALTFDPDMSDQTTPLTVFHHLPLLQIKEIQVGFGGQSLRLTASTKESVLTLYTHSQTLTQALTQTLLGVLSPGDQRVAHHPFLKEDLMALSLDWKAQVPDLLLDAGLRLSGHFHKTLADLVYILHGNMDREKPSLGDVRLLLYTTVGVTTTPDPRPDPWAQLFLTETHLGLVQENAVFHPAPRHLPLLSRQAQFQGVSLRCRSDIRCLMVGDWAGSSPAVGGDGAGDEGGAIRLDIILSRNRRTRGERWDRPREQPGRSAAAVRTVGRVAEAAILYADSNSCPSPHQQAEVWKLNFSCSSEAACLINHLSNVSMVTDQGLDRP